MKNSYPPEIKLDQNLRTSCMNFLLKHKIGGFKEILSCQLETPEIMGCVLNSAEKIENVS